MSRAPIRFNYGTVGFNFTGYCSLMIRVRVLYEYRLQGEFVRYEYECSRCTVFIIHIAYGTVPYRIRMRIESISISRIERSGLPYPSDGPSEAHITELMRIAWTVFVFLEICAATSTPPPAHSACRSCRMGRARQQRSHRRMETTLGPEQLEKSILRSLLLHFRTCPVKINS